MRRSEKICEGVRSLVVRYGDQTIPVSVSIGVAVFPDDGLSFEALYEAAAERLRCGKKLGRDRVCAGGESAL